MISSYTARCHERCQQIAGRVLFEPVFWYSLLTWLSVEHPGWQCLMCLTVLLSCTYYALWRNQSPAISLCRKTGWPCRVTDLACAGEVAIDLQRVGNHCKDIAAELHKVKADIKDRTPPSTALQLKQRNAALSDQLQQTAARWVIASYQCKGMKRTAVSAWMQIVFQLNMQ